MAMDWYKSVAIAEIDKHTNELQKFSNKVWKATRYRHKEVSNMDLITKFLKKNNFRVNYNLKGMPNTFEASYGASATPGNKRVNVAFLCRYDVSGKPSQFCGNHLVAEAAVAAALGVKAVLLLSCPTIGKVTVIGCPDTLDGGVATLVNLKVFKTVDVVMMAIPGNRTDWNPKFLGRKTFQATYKRQTSNTADKPDPPSKRRPCEMLEKQATTTWKSVVPPCDEQDICMVAYQHVMAMQEHFGKGWRLRATFGRTGRTHECRTVVCTVAPSNPELFFMEKRILPCLEAAAHSSSCEYEPSIAQKTYHSFTNNLQMCYLLQLNGYHCGILTTPLVKAKPIMEPVDIGNVSHVIPTLMPMFYVGTDADIGSEEFVKTLRSQTAHRFTVAMAKAIAMTAVDLFDNPVAITKVKDELKESLMQEKARSTYLEFPTRYPEKVMLKMDLPFEGNVGWSKNI